jgi:hypothetical protein
VWRRIAQSLQGPSHATDDSPCQDSFAIRVFDEERAPTLVACVADGAGSAKHSEVGSALACNTIVDSVEGFLAAGGALENLSRQDVLRWCVVARSRIESEASRLSCEVRDLATTIVAAIVTPTCSCFFQIGDGVIVVRRNGVYGVVFWPQSGEYANSTNFVTSIQYDSKLEFVSVGADVSDIALMTDGLERLALRFDTLTPHTPFFDPFFRALRTADDHSGLNSALLDFLGSGQVRERSDDDKTLILASLITD